MIDSSLQLRASWQTFNPPHIIAKITYIYNREIIERPKHGYLVMTSTSLKLELNSCLYKKKMCSITFSVLLHTSN